MNQILVCMGFSMAPIQSTLNQRNTTVPCFVALQAPNCGAGPSANKNPTQPTKNPQALLVSYVTQSHVHLNSLHNQKLSKFLIFHSHESQPLKGNVTSSSAMEDDLNHRNSTGFQIFFQGVPTLAARRRCGELVANLDACLLCDKWTKTWMLLRCTYCTKNIYVSYNHVYIIYIYMIIYR